MKQLNALSWGIVLLILAVITYVLYESVASVKTWINGFLNPTFPGGGETPGTSETYTGALETTISSPFQTMESIFGSGLPSTPSIAPSPAGTGSTSDESTGTFDIFPVTP